jgi:hypothetical protein
MHHINTVANNKQKTISKENKNIRKAVIMDNDYLIFECPNCDSYVEVNINETRCCVFRHGIYKETYQQISPHTSQNECERLINEDKIYGCCKPFYFIRDNINILKSEVIICDYI